MSQFKIGTVVQLKSGGPKMTCESEPERGEVHCQWFAGSKLADGFIPLDSLVVVNESAAPDQGKGK